MRSRTLIDLSHEILPGMITYQSLPTPSVRTVVERDESRYAPGVSFHIGAIDMCANTGTYLDVPFHRYENGHDLCGLSLDRVADVPAICVDRSAACAAGDLAIDLKRLGELDLEGCAVLFHTGFSANFGTPAYQQNSPFLTQATAEALVAANVACVGVDALNIDAMDDLSRPVHSILLKAGIPIIEHLRGLAELPRADFRFTAVPPKIAGMGTFTVRAFATVTRQTS